MDVMRLTVVERAGTVSFVAHSSAAVALTAACAADPTSLEQLLHHAERHDRRLRTLVLEGLAVFDRHNHADDLRLIHGLLATLPARETPVFRVLDAITRQASLESVRAGVVLYNLIARRIVQIQNTYQPLMRAGAVNYHNGRFLSIHEERYELPPHWTIVP
ncbi:MAG TPA: hypothetical protein VGR57_17240 [Ktedonobacterales bacterium]|nr:hypothetical protein [Ktedonobacterales bacterium]